MENGGADASLNDAHRLLVQLFLTKHVIPEAEFLQYYRKILDEYKERDVGVEEFVNKINDALRFAFFEIRKAAAEEDGKIYWGIANTRSDVTSQLATDLSLPDIELFKKIVEAIIAAPDEIIPVNGELGLIDCVNLAKGIEHLTLNKAEQTIQGLVKNRWLACRENPSAKTRHISLGVRTFLELKPWLEESFKGEGYLIDCILCAEPVFKGEHCANKKCEVRMHYHCAAKWFSRKDATKKCPTCTTTWQQS